MGDAQLKSNSIEGGISGRNCQILSPNQPVLRAFGHAISFSVRREVAKGGRFGRLNPAVSRRYEDKDDLLPKTRLGRWLTPEFRGAGHCPGAPPLLSSHEGTPYRRIRLPRQILRNIKQQASGLLAFWIVVRSPPRSLTSAGHRNRQDFCGMAPFVTGEISECHSEVQ